MNAKEKMRNRPVVRRWVIAVGAVLLMSVLAFTMSRPAMPSYALSLEKRDPTPEQTFARLVKLFELHDDFRREWVAAVVRRYADAYPQIDLAPFRFELVRALNDDYPGVRLLIADASPITKLVGPAFVQSSLKPYLKSSEQGLRNAAQELLFRAGFTNIVVDRTNAP